MPSAKEKLEELTEPLAESEIAELIFTLRGFPDLVDVVRRLAFQRDKLVGEVKDLRDLLRRLLAKLLHERHDLSAGWCAGCHVVHWCGDGKGKEPCKPDCVLQEAIATLRES